MKVLILSCNTGQGHNSASAAIRQALEAHGSVCDIEDVFGFVSNGVSKFMGWGHSCMYRHFPGIFRFGYGYAEEHEKVFQEDAMAYRFLTRGSEQIYQYCVEKQYDAIICAHVFSALAITDVKKKYPLRAKTYFVATDYTCSPSMGDSDLDGYFIPAEALTDEFAACGIPTDRIIPTGIPVRSAFFQPADRAKSRKKIGLPTNGPHLLIMCGSMGCGPMEELVDELAKRMTGDFHVSVMCGTNDKLKRKLETQQAHQPRIYMYGFTKDIPSMMDSADLYLTKPGGISVTEAAVKGLPMVFVNAVAGCETHNMRFFLERGGAVTAEKPSDIAALCVQLLRNDAKRLQMSAALKACICGDAAERICGHLHTEFERTGTPRHETNP